MQLLLSLWVLSGLRTCRAQILYLISRRPSIGTLLSLSCHAQKNLSEKIMQLCNCFKMSTSQSGNIIFSEVSKSKPKDSYLLQFTIFSSLNSCRTPYVANSVLPNLAKVDQDNEHDLLTLSSGTVIRLQVEDCTYESKIFENPP